MEDISKSVRDFNLNVAKPYDIFDGGDASTKAGFAVQSLSDRHRHTDSPRDEPTPADDVEEETQSASDDQRASNKKGDPSSEAADDDEKCLQTPLAQPPKEVRFVARLRGLPWSARQDDIVHFFAEENVSEVQIVYLTDGRASGEALVEFADSKSFQAAFLKNRQNMGHRYIEIFRSTGSEIDTSAGRTVRPPPSEPKSPFVIRMRGLPYTSSVEDVVDFFKTVKPTAVHLIKDDLGRPSGEGFAEFGGELEMVSAMAKHRHHMGPRYIELFRSSPLELMRALGLVSGWQPWNEAAPQSTCLLMRGLPYSCTENDITDFFQDVEVTPVRIHRKADGAEAYVEFGSVGDTDNAMRRHRSFISNRYIELFRVSYQDMASTVGLPVQLRSELEAVCSVPVVGPSMMGMPLAALTPHYRAAHHYASPQQAHQFGVAHPLPLSPFLPFPHYGHHQHSTTGNAYYPQFYH